MPKALEDKRESIIRSLRIQYPRKSQEELEQISWAIVNSQEKD
jgi:hypothetical protein